MTDQKFSRIVRFMSSGYGVELAKKKVIVSGRLDHYLAVNGFHTYSEFMDHVETDYTGREAQNLVDILTTNHTYFMREFEHFEFLRDMVLPELKKKLDRNHDLRIWSAAASTGEEPYTIAMLIKDFLGLDYPNWDTNVLATDISMKVLKYAIKGRYLEEQVVPLPGKWIQSNFRRVSNDEYEVRKELKDKVLFRQFNLMHPLPFKNKLHVVFLRNVMIYFSEETKLDLINRIYDCMEPGGYLFIGSAESINRSATKFQYIQPSVYRNSGGSNMRKLKVLVVEDSIVFREILVRSLNTDKALEVVATATDPYEARDAILKYHPDVMSLDIELPRMNGIDFLKKLMPQYPIPTVVISALSDKVFDALQAGAVDFINKPSGLSASELSNFFRRELITKIKIASTVRVGYHKNKDTSSNLRNRESDMDALKTGNLKSGDQKKGKQKTVGLKIGCQRSGTMKSATQRTTDQSSAALRSLVKERLSLAGSSGHKSNDNDPGMIVAIGASTDGTEAIFDVIKNFQSDIPGTVIVQHMPPGFTAMYAERLNNQCRVKVKEAKTGDHVVTGQVLIAPGDAHMRLIKVNGIYQVDCRTGPKVSGHCPSVDVLFESVAKTAGKNAVGVILTGMGKDGADGLLQMRKQGAYTIGQNEDSCVVYGMPKVAYDIGVVKSQIELQQIPGKIYQVLKNR